MEVESGKYLGEVSALCFVPPTFLLAGTGSEVLVYQLSEGKEIASFQVFDGIRVHGITPHSQTVAVFGERRVKLYTFQNAKLTLLSSLPKFSHWILDASFLQNDGIGPCIAIGCTDNSVWFWDTSSCQLLFHVTCSDRCLLYSMRMWGTDFRSLLIASGTIFNQIVVWKLDFNTPLSDLVQDAKHYTLDDVAQFCGQQYQVVCLCRITGHEGSIFHIAWASDGTKLVSSSDDRSARVWEINTQTDAPCSPKGDNYIAGPVLVGHTARVWDCCIYDDFIVTAGEDCTCRVWGKDGQQLRVIREHSGRGVWRCLYDPVTSLIVTAGHDSALKVHHMKSSTMESSEEVLTFTLPNSSGHIGLTDSKSEYVRCLHFSSENSLYVSTNNGFLHHILFGTGEEKWTELVHFAEGAPVVCMDLFPENSKLADTVENWIAMGNGKGSLMVIHVIGPLSSPRVQSSLVWSAQKERQLLGTYWCKSLGNRFIFTADPRGQLKLWRLPSSLASDCKSVDVSHDACLIQTYTSCFGKRIMCLDASSKSEVLVCGDIHGNVLLFPLSRDALFGILEPSELKTPPISFFKGAHGISRVCSISIASSTLDQVEISSTGQDGCISYLEYDKILRSLEFTGMKSVKELSAICSVLRNGDYNDDLDCMGYALGFASSDFIIWDLKADTKVLKVACGGWRRPHASYIGNCPVTNSCFAFVKDEIIYLYRNWVPESEKESYPQNLHIKFHGREIHAVSFITEGSLGRSHEMQLNTVGVATGCEDGTVRLTGYESGSKNWISSKLLGEHVGGSAVRSLCCVSKTFRMVLDVSSNEVPRKNQTMEDSENMFLLISVGAKRVVTAWKQKLNISGNREASCVGPGMRDENRPRGLFSSFQWLSTDMPTRNRIHDSRENAEMEKKATLNGVTKLNVSDDACENDWRYLAVTAFLVKAPESRFSVCFIVVASSDATVTLRALLLPCRLWYDVALLNPSSSPVLALQHVFIARSSKVKDELLGRNLYIVISGSTDGNITFWDLTKDVEDFMRQVSCLQKNDLIDSQKRPRTGRGSQGGRWWRTIGRHVSKNKPGGKHKRGSHTEKGNEENSSLSHAEIDIKDAENHTLNGTSNVPCCEEDAFASSHVEEENADDISTGLRKIAPLHVLENVHQSGVNCLHVSESKDSEFPENTPTFYLLSGGDDQALSCIGFNVTTKALSEMKFLSVEKVMSSHSSAVKGVWTDGSWVFSTGLDQRVRCWKIDQHGKLAERAHLVISVPEPEALDARACSGSHYQIIVAGRGMQMVEFCAS